jgi:epoxyqueuosine reductase
VSTPCVSIPDQNASAASRVVALARHLGFEAVGLARADAPLDQDVARYEAFVDQGMFGEMRWLAENRNARARLDTPSILAGAKSILCVALRYQRPSEVDSASPPFASAIARYARGRDYHRFMRRRLRRIAAFLRSLGSTDRPVRARPLCDEEPVLERAWAVRAGLGFVGKNGMLIVPGLGSMVLLGEVVTTLDLLGGEGAAVFDRPFAERCGACTRCLDACPTRAFPAPFVLDARRCVSYLTIEHRTSIAPELRSGIGSHVFGCDECQAVCPFNASAGARSPHRAASDPFAPLERWSNATLQDVLAMDDAAWVAFTQGSPLRRAGRAGLARNAAVVLANRGCEEALPALRVASREHDSHMVREVAAWAIERISAETHSA